MLDVAVAVAAALPLITLLVIGALTVAHLLTEIPRSCVFVVLWPGAALVGLMLNSSLINLQESAVTYAKEFEMPPVVIWLLSQWQPVNIVSGLTFLDVELVVLAFMVAYFVKVVCSHAVDTVRILKFALRVIATTDSTK